MGRKKAGFPLKLTGAVLVALRLWGAHHLLTHPEDDELRELLAAIPCPKFEAAADVLTRTVRVKPAQVETAIRLIDLAIHKPYLPPGCHEALRRRREKLLALGPIDRLGAVR